jgi:hypothetical protein
MEILERLAAKPEWTVDEIYELSGPFSIICSTFPVGHRPLPGRRTVPSNRSRYIRQNQLPQARHQEWGEMNQRPGDLIRKSIQGTLNEEEAKESRQTSAAFSWGC